MSTVRDVRRTRSEVLPELLGRRDLGIDPQRTRLALLAVLAYFGLVAAALVLDVALDVVTHWLLAVLLDRVRFLLVLAAPLAWAGAIGYAVWNGGPTATLALALLPDAVATILRFGLVLDVDVVATLVAASVASTVALVVTVRHERRRRPGSPALDGFENELLAATTATIAAILAYGGLLGTDLLSVTLPVGLFGLAFVPAVAVLGTYWLRWLGVRTWFVRGERRA